MVAAQCAKAMRLMVVDVDIEMAVAKTTLVTAGHASMHTSGVVVAIGSTVVGDIAVVTIEISSKVSLSAMGPL